MGRKRWMILAAGVSLAVIVSRPAAGLLVDMAGHWSAPLVGALQARGIVSGDESGRFLPDQPLTRAQLAKLMVTALGYEGDAKTLRGQQSRFDDISNWHWAKSFVEVLAETAAVEGYPDGNFRPEESVTRAQLATILSRVAGLADQARRMRFEQSGYKDDAEIPEWARGYVNVSRMSGLLSGFEDSTFRPLQPVTRAEASVALFRYLAMRGQVFDLSGTLLRFDSTTRGGAVLDAWGVERSFTMAADAQYYRGGLPSTPLLIERLDQVWIVLGPDGNGAFLDARFGDLLGLAVKAGAGRASITLPTGESRSFAVQPGALIYLNGLKASLDQVNGASAAYMVLDRSSGEVRVLDAVTPPAGGKLVGTDFGQSLLFVQSGSESVALRLTPDAKLLLNGRQVQFGDLRIGDLLQTVFDDKGHVMLVLAKR